MELDRLDSAHLGDLARSAMTVLADRGDQAAFRELLTMSGHAGACLGEAARRMASRGSWSAVADVSGTSKQAAWERWHA